MYEFRDPYTHPPLQDPSTQIRLCRYTADGHHDGTVPRLEIQLFSLDLVPAYIALSYEWGSASEDAPSIIVDEAALQIRPNLHDFLTTYPTAVGNCSSKWFWIDQITIDQSNIAERNAQVAIMGTIYSRAEEVLVWLGSARDAADAETYRTIKVLADHPFSDRIDTMLSHGEMLHVKEFFELGYWSRLWITQELAMAKRRRLLHGQTVLGWQDCVSAMQRLLSDFYKRDLFSVVLLHSARQSIGLMGYINSQEAPPDDENDCSAIAHWERLMGIAEGTQCLDPRDKIFVLQNLMPSSHRVRVDYRISIRELYIQAGATYIHALSQSPGTIPGSRLNLREGMTSLAWAMDIDYEPIYRNSLTQSAFEPGLWLPWNGDYDAWDYVIRHRCEYFYFLRTSDSSTSEDGLLRIARLIMEEFVTGIVSDDITKVFAELVISPAQQSDAGWTTEQKNEYAQYLAERNQKQGVVASA